MRTGVPDRGRAGFETSRLPLPASQVVLLVIALGIALGLLAGALVQMTQVTQRAPISAAYVAYWDQDRGFAEVQAHLDAFNEVSPWWYGMEADGAVVVQHPGVVDVDRRVVEDLQSQGVEVIPTIANHVEGSWTDMVSDVIRDPMLKQAHVESIVDLVVAEEYDGIDIDYENLRADDREAFSGFVRRLGRALRAEDKTLAVAVHAKADPDGVDERNEAQDYGAIGRSADQVRLMTYDRHWNTSEPGPVAPLGWVEDVVRYATSEIESEKVVLGIGAFGYDWVEGDEDGAAAAELTIEEAQTLAAEQDAEVQWDADAASPFFTYTDGQGREHTVWFENERSIAAKLALVEQYDLGGAFYWRMGGNDEGTLEIARKVKE